MHWITGNILVILAISCSGNSSGSSRQIRCISAAAAFFVFAVVHFVAAWMRWRKTLDKPRLDNAADSYAMKPTDDDDDDQCVRATAAAFSVLCRTS